MPGMRSPAQQMPERPVEYATQADVQILAAEIRGLREAMEAELRAQRESADARFEKVEGLLEGQQELIRMLSSRIDKVDARFDKVDARFEKVEGLLEGQQELIRMLSSRIEKVEGLLEGQQELIRMLSSRIDQVDAHLDRVDVRILNGWMRGSTPC